MNSDWLSFKTVSEFTPDGLAFDDITTTMRLQENKTEIQSYFGGKFLRKRVLKFYLQLWLPSKNLLHSTMIHFRHLLPHFCGENLRSYFTPLKTKVQKLQFMIHRLRNK